MENEMKKQFRLCGKRKYLHNKRTNVLRRSQNAYKIIFFFYGGLVVVTFCVCHYGRYRDEKVWRMWRNVNGSKWHVR